jgi:hypothetical protein
MRYDEELGVAFGTIDRLMWRHWRNFQTRPGANLVLDAVQFHRQDAGEHEEELPRPFMMVPEFRPASRHPLMYHL